MTGAISRAPNKNLEENPKEPARAADNWECRQEAGPMEARRDNGEANDPGTE
jgi:hypothetical protein